MLSHANLTCKQRKDYKAFLVTFFPKITIVTVTYNAEAYLEQTIQSVLGQNYPNLEYIIIDGASTDGTVDIIKKYEKQIAYWVSEPDDGIYYAMNKGIDAATGEWINFMNAGDSFYRSSTLLDVARFMEEAIEVVYGGASLLGQDGVVGGYNAPIPMESEWEGSYFNHQDLFVILEKIRLIKFDTFYKIAAEKKLFLQLFLQQCRYKKLDTPLVNFQISEDSVSKKQKIKDSVEMLHILASLAPSAQMLFSHEHYARLQSYASENSCLASAGRLALSRELSILYAKASSVAKCCQRIVFYGYGSVAKMIEHLFVDNTILIVDSCLENSGTNHPVYSPDAIKDLIYDGILITALGREEEISNALMLSHGVPSEKIFTL